MLRIHISMYVFKQGLVPPYLYNIQRDRESGLTRAIYCELL